MIDAAISHVAVWVVGLLVLGGIVAVVVVRPQHVFRVVATGLGGVLSVYAVGRGIAEFFVVDYSQPATYRSSWGGPSLVGVFAVHSGPGLAVLVAGCMYLHRKWKGRRRLSAQRQD